MSHVSRSGAAIQRVRRKPISRSDNPGRDTAGGGGLISGDVVLLGIELPTGVW
jgi:hypothetical protein